MGKYVRSRLYPILLACLFAPAIHASAPPDIELLRLTANIENAMTQRDMNIASEDLAEFWNARITTSERKIAGMLEVR
jgi:hypothetical protein